MLVLNPGTSASAAYFEPLAKDIVSRAKGWQVWAVERRENLLEDQSLLDLAKAGKLSGQQLFDYYLGWVGDSSISPHFQLIPDSSVGYARQWGMHTEIEDLRRVVLRAEQLGGHVVVGGHSLGGSITTAYATWDFHGKPGADGLSGLVYIDGGSSPRRSPPRWRPSGCGPPDELALARVRRHQRPFAGLFNATGALGSIIDPNSPVARPVVPAAAAQSQAAGARHQPRPVRLRARREDLAAEPRRRPGAPRAARRERRPARLGQRRRAHPDPPLRGDVLRLGAKGLDGTAWYHPMRLTIDAGAVGNGLRNPAQKVLDVNTVDGRKLPRNLRIYAFGAALGGANVLGRREAARQAVAHPGAQRLTLINRASTYAHNDPAGASPKNDFLSRLVPFLRRIAG